MSWCRAILWAFVASSYFWSIGGANAAQSDPRPIYVTNGMQVIGNAIARHLPFTFANSPSGVGAGAVASMPINGRVAGALDVPFTMKRNIPWGPLMRGAARALPVVGTATALADLAGVFRCSWSVSLGGIECDLGQGEETTSGIEWDVSGHKAGSCNAAVQAYRDAAYPSAGGASCQITMEDGRQRGFWTIRSASGACCVASGVVYGEVKQVTQCPPGESKSVFDGKCTGGSKVVVTPEDFSTRFSPYVDNQPSPPPGTPNPADVAREAVQAGRDLGAETGVGPIVMSGPPQTIGQPTTTTTTTPGGGTSTTTTTNIYNYTYAGDTVSWSTTTRTEHPDGTIEETTDSPDDNVPMPNDPAMPAQPTLYERKYPQGLVGVWNEKSVELQQTPIFAFLQQLVPNTGDGGCPQWSIPSGLVLGIQVGGDVSVPCFVWSFIRLVMIIGALLLARALIFGG